MPDDSLITRIEARIAELGTTERAVSMLVTNKPDLIRDIRRKGAEPKRATLDQLAEALETTVEFLLYGKSTGRVLADRRTGYDPGPGVPALGQELPRTLAVKGTALAADLHFGEDDELSVEAHIIEQDEDIDWIRRPPLLEGRKDVYALYIAGTSMEPKFEAGDPVIVDTRRPPSPGDYVIVQMETWGPGQAVERTALIKRLVRRTAKAVELRQFNPDLTFTVVNSRVAAMHRVLSMQDIIG